MHYGGHWMMFALALLTIFLLIRSNRRFRRRQAEDKGDTLFQTILNTEDKEKVWELLLIYITGQQRQFLDYASTTYSAVTEAFASENVKVLGKAASSLIRQKNSLKNTRRKETLGLRRIRRETAIEMSAWFHLSNNCCMSMLYNLSRINEICREHVDNNFMPLPEAYRLEYNEVRSRTDTLFNDTLAMIDTGAFETIPMLRRHCDEIKDYIAAVYHRLQNRLREDNPASMTVLYVYINVLQETQEMVSTIRKYLRAYAKLHGAEANPRPIVTVSA